MEKVPASKKTRKQIQDLVNSEIDGGPSQLVRLAASLVIEELMEQETTEKLGRGYYERSEDRKGYRNGYKRRRLKSAEGMIPYREPQVRGIESFRSRIRDRLSSRTDELERLATEMFARGLSTRDIEALTTDDDGNCLLSRSGVSRVTETLWQEYEEFVSRPLDQEQIEYLFIDGVAEKLRASSRREAVLVAWGIDSNGEKMLLHVAPGTKEDLACCSEFIRDMQNRGLRDPVVVATDGAPGLIRAVETCFPRSLRQRCLAHRYRNLGSKVPDTEWPQIKEKAKEVYQASSSQLAHMLKERFVAEYERSYPTMVRCFLDDFEACIAQLQLPLKHRRTVRTTNLLERLFGEERRRTKVIPHGFSEKPVLKMMYAAMIRASDSWRAVPMTDFERRQLDQLRKELAEAHRERNLAAKKATRSQNLQTI